jgi:hypothetical protein
MKKLDTPQSKEYGPLVIWVDDLTRLFSELENYCSMVKLVADDLEFDSVEEFVTESRGRRPTTVTITARNPYITLELHQRHANLFVHSSELASVGLFLKLDVILSRCERKPKFLYRYLWVVISVSIFPAIFHIPPLKPYSFHGYWVSALLFSWMLYVASIHLRRFSIVHSLHRENRPSFFRKNWDAIVIAVISALVGAFGSAVAPQIFADKAWRSSFNRSEARDAP